MGESIKAKGGSEMTIVECIMAGTGELCIDTCPVKCWEAKDPPVANPGGPEKGGDAHDPG